MDLVQFGKHIHYLHCSDSACSDCTLDFGSSTLVAFEKTFFLFYLSFPTIIFSSFILKLVIYLVIPKVLLHFRWGNPRVVGSPSSKYIRIHWNVILLSLITDALGRRWKVDLLSTHLFNFLEHFLEPFHFACGSHS